MPVSGARPSYHSSREAKQRQAGAADPVDEVTGRSWQQVLVEANDPLDFEGVPGEFVTIDNQAARDAHQENVRPRHRAHPQMNQEEDIAHSRSNSAGTDAKSPKFVLQLRDLKVCPRITRPGRAHSGSCTP